MVVCAVLRLMLSEFAISRSVEPDAIWRRISVSRGPSASRTVPPRNYFVPAIPKGLQRRGAPKSGNLPSRQGNDVLAERATARLAFFSGLAGKEEARRMSSMARAAEDRPTGAFVRICTLSSVAHLHRSKRLCGSAAVADTGSSAA